jgi:hypothetical protein
VANRELDNIVDLNIPTPWPLPPVQVIATLAHSFEVSGGLILPVLMDLRIS